MNDVDCLRYQNGDSIDTFYVLRPRYTGLLTSLPQLVLNTRRLATVSMDATKLRFATKHPFITDCELILLSTLIRLSSLEIMRCYIHGNVSSACQMRKFWTTVEDFWRHLLSHSIIFARWRQQHKILRPYVGKRTNISNSDYCDPWKFTLNHSVHGHSGQTGKIEKVQCEVQKIGIVHY